MEEISSKVVWDDSIVLQVEGGDRNDGYIYQLRYFADRNPHELYEWNLNTNLSVKSRMFGTTAIEMDDEDKEWYQKNCDFSNAEMKKEKYIDTPLVLPLRYIWLDFSKRIIWHGAKRYNESQGSEPSILYQSTQLERKDAIEFVCPQNMNVYLGASSDVALSHLHTRYIQKVL